MLTLIVTIIYYTYLLLALIALIGIPAVRLFASNSDVSLGLVEVPVATAPEGAPLRLPWGDGLLKIEARAAVELPLSGMPWLTLGIVWIGVALYLLAILAVLHQQVAGGAIEVPGGVQVDPALLIAGVVLVALSEVFRRGTQLEAEQALVV